MGPKRIVTILGPFDPEWSGWHRTVSGLKTDTNTEAKTLRIAKSSR